MKLRSRVLLPLCLLAPLGGLLAGCGPGRNQFAPLCPAPRLVPALADVTRYRDGRATGDLTDLVLQARVVSVKGSCKAGSDTDQVAGTVQIGITVQRGPAMVGREADIPVFLAVTLGDEVRDKQIFPVHVVFPPNVDRMTLTSQDISLDIPVTDKVSGASYGLIAGFQLTPGELDANRHAQGRS